MTHSRSARGMSDLFKIADSGERRTSAIFVHGLGGDAFGTWGWLGPSIVLATLARQGPQGPCGLVGRLRGAGLALARLGDAPHRSGDEHPYAGLLAEPALRDGPLILIGHSLGGLIIKQLLRTAESEARHRGDAAELIARVEKGRFPRTPHTGAGLANWVTGCASWPGLRRQRRALCATIRTYAISISGIATGRTIRIASQSGPDRDQGAAHPWHDGEAG